MLLKEEVKNIITRMKKESSEETKIIEQYISGIDNMSEEKFEEFLKQNNVLTQDDVVSFVQKSVDKQIQNRPENKFKKLNETIGYGLSDDTLHIHVMPAELKDALSKDGRKRIGLELIDALEKIQNLIKDDENYKDVKQVYAVSSILRGPILEMFKDLDFDTRCIPIKEAQTDDEFAKFYDKFKDGKYLGSAKVLKEKILSEDWIKNKDNVKTRLKHELGIEDNVKEESKNSFKDGLKQMVNDEETIASIDSTISDRKKDKTIEKINEQKTI